MCLTLNGSAWGGGYNCTLLVNLPGGAMVANNNVVVNITLGVAKRGTLSLAYVVEAVSGAGALGVSSAQSAPPARSKTRD